MVLHIFALDLADKIAPVASRKGSAIGDIECRQRNQKWPATSSNQECDIPQKHQQQHNRNVLLWRFCEREWIKVQKLKAD